MAVDDDKMPLLGEIGRDRVVALGKGALGAIPFVGSIIAEAVTQFIPQQRFERLEDYCRRLEERLSMLEPGEAAEKMKDPERVDLFEEGAVQSARALSTERRAWIATVVANGMTGDEKEAIEAKRILKLLAAIDDDQVIILTSYLHRHLHDDAFYSLHQSVLEPPHTHMGSTAEELRRDTMYQLARSELVRLGLLRVRFAKVKKGEVPEFDERTGMMKGGSRDLSPLGRLLLAHIGLAAPDEY